MIGYKLHFPGKWELEFSVFYDDEGKKVAELFPPIIMEQGQTLLDTWEASDDCELVSRDNIRVGDLKGERIIVKAYPHSGEITEWYLYTYYLTDGQKVFAISFYSEKLDEEKQKGFERILESFEFMD